MEDIHWRKNACALNCLFLRQGYKGSFVCTKYGGATLDTGKDGAPTATPNCNIVKIREEKKKNEADKG